jgi:hypothetical protein
MRNRRYRWFRRIAVSFAFAAIAAPSAQARIAEDSGVGVVSQVTSIRPDDRSVRGVPQSADVTAAVRPDDRVVRFSPVSGDEGLVLRRDPGAAVDSPVVALPATGGEGFDWGDAGVGAAIMLGFLLLATGAAAARRQSRKSLAEA